MHYWELNYIFTYCNPKGGHCQRVQRCTNRSLVGLQQEVCPLCLIATICRHLLHKRDLPCPFSPLDQALVNLKKTRLRNIFSPRLHVIILVNFSYNCCSIKILKSQVNQNLWLILISSIVIPYLYYLQYRKDKSSLLKIKY